MKTLTVPLTQGKSAIIDEIDAWVLEWKWFANMSCRNPNWYAVRTDRGTGRTKLVRLHREILIAATGGDRPGMLVDHRNGDTMDNRRYNLRWADKSDSNRNTGLRRNNASGIKGVSWHKPMSKWRAKIQHHGRDIHIGYFTTIEAAADARLEAAKRYHGEFASEISRGLTPTQ